jgi:hypothetical protein
VVTLDEDLKPSTFEVVSPLLLGSYCSQQFTVVRVIVLLSGRSLPRVE